MSTLQRKPHTRLSRARSGKRRGIRLELFASPRLAEQVAEPLPASEARGLDFATRFGHNLARCRERTTLSQEELGLRAGLHRTAVGQLERGERVARTDTLVKLAGSLGVRPEELLAGLEWRPAVMTEGELTISDDR